MKAKVIKTFKDKHSGEIYKVGDILTISRDRYKEILSVEPLVEEIKEEKKQPKKTTK